MLGKVRLLPVPLRKWYIAFLICLIASYSWLLLTNQTFQFALITFSCLFLVDCIFTWLSENFRPTNLLGDGLLYIIWLLPFLWR
jgi:hypothetical protein